MLFRIYTPDEALEVISQLISNRLNLTTQINFLFIESVIWFSLLAATLKYFQSVVFIERQYDYIHQLEDQISKEYDNHVFTRESASYLKNYPFFLNWTSLLYTIFSPILLVLIIISKIICEIKEIGFNNVLFWFNGISFLLIFISTVLYLKLIHFKKNNPLG